MKVKSMVPLLILAGIMGILATLWSGAGNALGPVRMGQEGIYGARPSD